MGDVWIISGTTNELKYYRDTAGHTYVQNLPLSDQLDIELNTIRSSCYLQAAM